jgi:hypothetical protein
MPLGFGIVAAWMNKRSKRQPIYRVKDETHGPRNRGVTLPTYAL